MGVGIPYEEATTATVLDMSATFEPRYPGRGYTSSKPLHDLVDIPVFPAQHAAGATPLSDEAPSPYPWTPEFLLPTGTMDLYRRLQHYRLTPD